jgi:hypothetical protein
MPERDYDWWRKDGLPDVEDAWLELTSYSESGFRFELHVQTHSRNTRSRNTVIADILTPVAQKQCVNLVRVLGPFLSGDVQPVRVDIAYYCKDYQYDDGT